MNLLSGWTPKPGGCSGCRVRGSVQPAEPKQVQMDDRHCPCCRIVTVTRLNKTLNPARLGALCLPRARGSHMGGTERLLVRSCLKRIYPCFISRLELLNQFCLLREYSAPVCA